jgi:hypothetical protein
LRPVCWRPRACPPFLAAAFRLVEELALDLDELELEERLRGFADERLRLEAERLLDERLLPERLDPLDFFLPPELPLLRRSAICSPS